MKPSVRIDQIYKAIRDHAKKKHNTISESLVIFMSIEAIHKYLDEFHAEICSAKYCRECGEFIKECDRHDGLCVSCGSPERKR